MEFWLEGPSDRIYLNHWIDLFSDGRLREGRHYQCAFYGGSLLSNYQATHEQNLDSDLINLLTINPNAVVISDSDRKSEESELKPRVTRIRDEFAKLDPTRTFHWILGAREIENYLTKEVINALIATPIVELQSPTQFESFFPKVGESDYLTGALDRKTFDKPHLAALAVPHMSRQLLEGRFDLGINMEKIVKIIEEWNK